MESTINDTIIVGMKERLDNLERFNLIADELGLELSEQQKGILLGHKLRLKMEIKTLEGGA